MSAYSNDSQGWEPIGKSISVAPATTDHPLTGVYDGTNCPDATFEIYGAGVVFGSLARDYGLERLWKAGGTGISAKEAIKDFNEDRKLAKGQFNVSRHFWTIEWTGRVVGLLMGTKSPGVTPYAILVHGYVTGVHSCNDTTEGTVAFRDTYDNLEAKILAKI